MKVKEIKIMSILCIMWISILFMVAALINYIGGYHLPDMLLMVGALFLICGILTNVDDDTRASSFQGNELSVAQNLVKMQNFKSKKSSIFKKWDIKEGMLSLSVILASFITIYISFKL